MQPAIDGVMHDFSLTVTNYSTDRQWSWELSSSGIPIARHDVQVDPADPSFEAFTNIQAYVTWRVPPRAAQSVKSGVLDDLGRWITPKLFGPIAAVLCNGSSADVNVVLPPAAAHFASWPFELAWYDGGAIAVRDVVFTYEVNRGRPGPADRPLVEAPIRILGVFALPVGQHPLSLRNERRHLEGLFRQMSADSGLDVRFSFVQYGVTRERLTRVLRDPEGWDIVHFSAHGVAGGLALEAPDGSLDVIGSNGLLHLVEHASPRPRLIVLSSCSSAGAEFDRSHRQLATPDDPVPAREPSLEVPVLGSVLADKANCAVLAMRFPVSDRYAADLSLHLYRHLIEQQRPLTQALRDAVANSTPRTDVLQRVAPVLLGSGCDQIAFKAASLTANPADQSRTITGSGTANTADTFVGRTETIARAIAALAPGGTITAVVLHGMPGSGRTATAAEIAHAAAESFEDVVWLGAPTGDGCQADSERIAAHDVSIGLAANTARRVLFVVDDVPDSGSLAKLLESFAHDDGPRLLITALRRLTVPHVGVLWEPLGLLSAEESALLVEYCRNLQALVTESGSERVRTTALANHALVMAMGSPGLITLADAHAQSYDRLHQWTTLLGGQWSEETHQGHGIAPDASQTAWLAQRMLEWTRLELAFLPQPAADLLQTICGLEEHDRLRWFVREVWLQRGHGDDLAEEDDLAKELERAQIAIFDDAAETLCDRTLVQLAQADSDAAFYVIPTVVDLAVQQGTTPRIAHDINVAAKDGWLRAFSAGTALPHEERSDLVGRACRSIVPYLLRLNDPDRALNFLIRALAREFPDTAVTDSLRLTRQIADATAIAANRRLAIFTGIRLRARVDPAVALQEADTFLSTLDDQELRADVRTLKIALLQRQGRYIEALALADENLAAVERHPDVRRRFDAEGTRLQILRLLGRYEEAYERAQALWQEMDSARAAPGQSAEDPYLTWSSYELILQAGALAARHLDKYDESLAMNRALRRSMRERRAPPLWQANALYDDFLPLLKLDRVREARQVCLEVLPVARAYGDRLLEAMALGSLSEVEWALGYNQDAYQAGMLGLTLLYDVRPFERMQLITVHNRMANIYKRLNRWPEAFVHRMACVMLCELTDSSDREELLRLAEDLCYFHEPPLPTDARDVTAKLTAMHSVDFAAVIHDLAGNLEAGERAYQAALTRAREIPLEELFPIEDLAVTWGLMMTASAAAANGDRKAHIFLHRILDSSDDPLARAFKDIADGSVPQVDSSTLSPLDEYILNITHSMVAGETRISFTAGPLWENPDLDIIEHGLDALRAFARGAPHDNSAVEAYLDSLERSGSEPFARALRLFISGERSRLLALGLPAEEAELIMGLIRDSQTDGDE
jgi:CHAT domain